MPATEEKTYRYQVETDQGTFELELDQPVPDGDAGQKMLEQLLHQELQPQAEQSTAQAMGRGVVGGLRDFGQQFVDLPVSIANTITEFISPEPPGKPAERGPRGRVVPELDIQLPDPTGDPQSGLERGIRTGTTIAADIASIAIPAARAIAARRAARRAPMLFEKGSVRRDMAVPRGRRTDLRLEPGSPASRPASRFDKPVPTRGVPQPESILTTPPSQSARNLAKLFEFNADDIPKMTLERAMNARRRILTRIPDYPMYQEGTPIFELMQRLEQRILSFR